MRHKVPTVVLAALAVALAALAANFREELANVPRVRVGPLVTEEPGKPALRFFAVGDTGTGGDEQLAVAAAMEARCQAAGGIDGLLLLGDNAYQNGFTSVDDPQWQTKIFGPYGGDCLAAAPIYPVLGNHDYKGNPAAQIEYSLINKRWRMPNRFYAVRFGQLLELVAFDSQMSEICFKPAFCSVDFLLDQIKTEGKPPFVWTIVIAHHPIASSSTHGHGHVGGLREIFMKPVLCDRIDAWIAGHAHHLEHREPDCRMQLFVSGGGGAELYPVKPYEQANGVGTGEVRYAESRNGFLELELDGTRLKTQFIGTEGQVLHVSERLKLDR